MHGVMVAEQLIQAKQKFALSHTSGVAHLQPGENQPDSRQNNPDCGGNGGDIFHSAGAASQNIPNCSGGGLCLRTVACCWTPGHDSTTALYSSAYSAQPLRSQIWYSR